MAGRAKLLRRPSLVDQPGHLLWPINIRDGAGERRHLHADHPGARARRTPPCAATRHPRDRRPLPRDARGARPRRRRLVGRRGGRPVAVPIRSVPRPGRLVPRAWTQPRTPARCVSPHLRSAGSLPPARAAPWRPTGALRHDRPWRERGRAPLRPRADTRALGGAHAPAPVACLAAKSAGRRDGVGQRLRAPLLSASRRRRRSAGRCGRAFGPDRAAPLPARGSARRVARRGGRGDGRERLAGRASLCRRGRDSLRAAARRPARARYGAAGTGGPRAAGALAPHAVPRRAPPAVATARLAPCRRPRARGRPGERLSRRVGDPGPPRRARQPHRGSHRGAARGEHTPSRRADPHDGRDARDAGGARPSDPGGPRRAAVLAAGSAGSGGMTSLASSLSARRGTPEWDAVLRATGILALVAIYPASRWPDVAALAGFLCVTLFVSGPISMVLPAAFEPMLMVAGRLYPPLLVTVLAVAGNLYMDYVNYHVYDAIMRHPRLEQARNSWIVRKTLVLFQRSPFFAVWLCAWSPIPYWIVSVLAPLSRYSMRKYLFATFLGRAPRVWFFATLGLVIPVSTQVLATFAIAAVVTGVVVALHGAPRALFRRSVC